MDDHDPSMKQGREAETERERLLAQVREANSRLVLTSMEARRRAAELEAALSSMADGVAVYGPDGSIIRMNQAAEEILGFSPEEKQLPIEQRLKLLGIETEDGKPLDPEKAQTPRALRGETVRGSVVVLHHPEGRTVWVSVSAAPIMMANGEVIGAITTFTDITQLHELQNRLKRLLETEQEARALAERAVKIRDEFISVAAHELKTPVTSIQGFSQVMVRQFEKTGRIDPARLTKALETISRQTKKLTKLTEQLLNVSRLETGKLTLTREQIDLSSLVASVVAALRSSHPDRVITLGLPGDRAIPAFVDALRLEQVFTNLLDNALKFSPADSPVEVRLEQEEARCWASLSVRDYGIGVPEGQREMIFERFHQAHAERHYGGMGIGLYLSRQLVEMHGGSIEVEQPEDGGSRFVVHTPLICD